MVCRDPFDRRERFDHARVGGGSNQHMWGRSTATKVLFDSLIVEKSDGTVIIGRGVPDVWIRTRQEVGLTRDPVSNGGRLGYQVTTAGKAVTLQLTGNTSTPTGNTSTVTGNRLERRYATTSRTSQ
ncbi:hypothetical protein ACWF0M_37965 [Kribbella sp. NPDC055110]